MEQKTKKILANTVAIVVMLLFGLMIFLGESEPTPLQGGDIQKAITTEQYK